MREANADSEKTVLIVGAGMAGLSCGLRLQAAGVPVQIFEASDAVGGRVRTDAVDGYLLDRGFQVYLDAYPEAGKLLDLDALDLRSFAPGALVYRDGALHRLMDVVRRPATAFSSLKAPVGLLWDKLRVGYLRMRLCFGSLDAIDRQSDQTTNAYLAERGFSADFVDRFFRSFYGGIFLERELNTSSRMFEFTFRMFSKGSATVPAAGMGAIPKQLASRLDEGTLHLEQPVSRIGANSITLHDGREVKGAHVVVATDSSQLHSILPEATQEAPKWRSATNLYFSADISPVKEAIICLNSSKVGLVNSVCVLSELSDQYAPQGKSLISVAFIGLPDSPDLVAQVRSELKAWFGEAVGDWSHLRTDRIPYALPEQAPSPEASLLGVGYRKHENIWICGDHTTTASIEGAVISGQRVADALLKTRA